MSAEEVENPKEEIQLDEQKEGDIQNQPENEDLNYKELFFMHPSQKDKKKKDFTEYSRIDMSLLNKKRERKEKEENVEDNENNNKLAEDKNINTPINGEEANDKKEDINKDNNEEQNNNNQEEEIKENDLENNLPKELLELIEERKDKEPFTAADFEKYKVFKKLNINFGK